MALNTKITDVERALDAVLARNGIALPITKEELWELAKMEPELKALGITDIKDAEKILGIYESAKGLTIDRVPSLLDSIKEINDEQTENLRETRIGIENLLINSDPEPDRGDGGPEIDF